MHDLQQIEATRAMEAQPKQIEVSSFALSEDDNSDDVQIQAVCILVPILPLPPVLPGLGLPVQQIGAGCYCLNMDCSPAPCPATR